MKDMIGDDIVLRIKVFKYMLSNPHMTFRIINDKIVDYRLHDNNLHKNIEREIKLKYQVQKRYGNGLLSKSISSLSMQGIRQYMQKIDNFILQHTENTKIHRNNMISILILHYSNLYTGDSKSCNNIHEILCLSDVKIYFKKKIKEKIKKYLARF